MPRKIVLIILLAVILLFAVVFSSLFCLSKEFPSANSVNKEGRANFKEERADLKEEQADLDNNSFPEIYTLKNNRLTITIGDNNVWQSPADWRVDNFILADSNNDGIVEINLSVWKIGDFGTSQPFWIKNNDLSLKNHFFIFSFVKGKIQPLWQSSNLEAPNCDFMFADVDGDGRNDLVVIEGDYSQPPACQGNYAAVWKWNGWGFSNEWRSAQGDFSNVKISDIKLEF